jgi:dihydroxyacetone kinase-like protein
VGGLSVADGLDVGDFEAWIREFARSVTEHRDELTALDSAIGDADHGTNMDRGMSAAVAALEAAPPADPAALLKQVGMTLISKVGGASGPLYGTLFLRMAGSLATGPADDQAFARALRAGLDGVVARGKAEPGDKTMLDALVPACDALDAALAAGQPLDQALAAAAEAARKGRDATVPLVARKGRASYLGERSAGHQDPGATSTALLLDAAVSALGGR